MVCFKAVTSSARTMANLTGSGNQRKRSGPKNGSRNDPESGQQDKDSKNSTTLKNGSSKTFLTDTVGKAAGNGNAAAAAAAATPALEEEDDASSSSHSGFMFEFDATI